MNINQAPEKLWDKRERYEQTPDRYNEISSKKQIVSLFEEYSSRWHQTRSSIKYADLGCGEGKGTAQFSKFLSDIVGLPLKTMGIDASSECALPCKERGIDFRRLELGTDSLNLEDFQVITMFETIEHIFNTDRLLETTRDSMSKDGLLLVTTLNVACLKNRFLVPLGIQPFNTEVSTKKLSYGYKYEFLRKRMNTWKPAGHIRPFTLLSLRELLEDNGFKVIQSHGLENWGSLKFLERIGKNMCTGIFVVAKPN